MVPENLLPTIGGSVPQPDPTAATTAALFREIDHVKELAVVRSEYEEQLRAMTTQLSDEKFKSVQDKLAVAEQLRVEQKADTAQAVQAALAAAKEAVNAQASSFSDSVNKSELAATRQMEQITATFKNAIDNMLTNQSDVKDRVNKIEHVKLGGTESKAGIYAAIGIAITVVLAVLSVITFAVS